MVGYSLKSLYAVAGHAVTARELSIFTKFLIIDGSDRGLPPTPKGSEATDAQRYEFVRRLSAVERGAPINTGPPTMCNRKGEFE